MAKDVIIVPGSGEVTFYENGSAIGRMYQSGNNIYLNPVGEVVLGDGTTAANIELGTLSTSVDLNFLGGGNITANGGVLSIGQSGDIVNLNVSGVTYNLPSNITAQSLQGYVPSSFALASHTHDYTNVTGLTTYVTTQINDLIAGAPGALNTLDELAAALGDDANFATTVTNSLATKAPLASPALTGTPTAPTAATATNNTQIATTAFVKAQGYITSADGGNAGLLDGIDSTSFLRSDAADTFTNILTGTATGENLIVGGIRGTTKGSQTGQYIHLYERVHIGGPNGWGASTHGAPGSGLSTWGSVDFGMNGTGVIQLDGTTIVTAARALTNVTNTNWDAAYSWGNHAGLYLGINAKAADSNLLDGLDSTAFMRATNANGYYGLATPGGAASDWIRTTVNGLIPYQSGGSSSIGTSSWPFYTIYGTTLYENGTALSSKYLGISAKASDSFNLNGSDWNTTDKVVRWGGSGYHGNPRSMSIGYSGGNYGQFGYGIDFTATSGVHTYAIADTVTRVDLYGGLVVYGAAGGTVGTNISWTETFRARYTDSAPTFKGSTIWHAGNFNPASYLGISAKAADSNLLDGIDSGSFLRSDADDTFGDATKTLTIAGVVRSDNNGNVYGPNFNVSTTNKTTSEYAYRVDRSGTVVGGITIGGQGVFADGLTVGTASFSASTINNWNTAYGWGDHAGLYSASDHEHSGGTLRPNNVWISNAIYFGGGNNYLNWTSNRVYTNVGFQSAGTIYANGGNSDNWNTAYGWGNHASAGYANYSHKYHTFSNGDEYYDSYGQNNNLRLFTENATFDNFRFRSFSNVEYFNGTNWVSWAQSLETLFDGREETGFSLGHANSHFRFEINRSSGWPTTALFVIQSTWSDTNSHTCEVTLETWNGSAWVQKDNWTYSNFQRGINLHTTSQTHDGFAQMRVTINMNWADASHNYYPLRRILFLSNFSGGATDMQPFTWEYNKNVTFSNQIYVSGGNSSQWNTAYGWGNHASAGYITSSGSISGNAATATLASTVTINYNNNSNSTYQMLWGSGNSVYGTGSVYLNPSTNYVYASSFNAGDWFRSSGATGWYNGTYGGGIYMTDGTWVRVYNNKQFLSENLIQSNTAVYAPIFYDSNNSNYYVDPNGTSVLSSAHFDSGILDNASTRVVVPGGAYSVGSPSGTGGAIKISLPTAVYGSNTMMSMTVHVYEYNTGQSFTIKCGGYNYYTHDWYNVFAYMLNDSGKGGDVPVYFGNDGTRDVIWIGNSDWSWSYPNVFVTDFQAGHTQNSNWKTGWSVSFDTAARTNVTASRTAYRQIDTGTIGSQSVSTAAKLTTARNIALSGDVTGSANFDGSGNITITATVADNSHSHSNYAPLASPALTGTPTAPTASAATNTTQIATTAFVQTAVSNLVSSAPATLDTLNELAAALGDDPNFATTVSTSIGTKVSKTGDTMTGDLTMSGDSKVVYGPNSGWGKYLIIGGNANNSTANHASIGVTNGNLHIDAATSSATYLNFYDGAAGVAFGSGAGAAVAWMGPDGDLWKGSSDNNGSKYWHAGDFANNSSNWNTAYNWGNHATAGYLTSVPAATSTVRGGVELFSDTVQSVAANAVTATASRTYGVQLNSAGQAVVNVPWVDTNTNTTYSAGTALTLSGTTFSVTDNAIGATQLNVSGNGTTAQYLRSDGDGSFTWATPPDTNTTYSAGTGLTLSGTTFSVTANTYAAASHTHDDRYYTESESDNRYVRKDTTGQYLKPFNEYTSNLPDSSTANSIVSQMGGGGLRVDFLSNASFGSWAHAISFSGYNGYNMYQLAGHYKGSGGLGPDLYVRCEPNHAQNSWSQWEKLWHTGNDGSGSGLDADLLDGLQLHTSRNNEVNKVVRTDGNGYIQAGWINTTSGNNGTTSINKIYASHDDYIRYYSPENFRALITDGVYALASHTHSAGDITSGTLSTARLPTPTSGNWWNGGAIVVGTDGVMEVGKYMDWHETNAGTSDYDYRMYVASGRMYMSGDLEIDGGDLYINDGNTRLHEGNGNMLRVTTDSGYIEIGPANTSHCHIQTDRSNFYFNTELRVDGGIVGSYNEDLQLRRAGSNKIYVADDTTTSYNHFVPDADRTKNLGTDALRWQIVFCETLDSAGLHEANLASRKTGFYATGTVLVWKDGEAVPCTDFADYMKIGIAVYGNPSPLVQGAEPVLCTGEVNEGDYLVTSQTEGHAIAMSRKEVKEQDIMDCVIGKALESGNGESHLIKTWVNI